MPNPTHPSDNSGQLLAKIILISGFMTALILLANKALVICDKSIEYRHSEEVKRLNLEGNRTINEICGSTGKYSNGEITCDR